MYLYSNLDLLCLLWSNNIPLSQTIKAVADSSKSPSTANRTLTFLNFLQNQNATIVCTSLKDIYDDNTYIQVH